MYVDEIVAQSELDIDTKISFKDLKLVYLCSNYSNIIYDHCFFNILNFLGISIPYMIIYQYFYLSDVYVDSDLLFQFRMTFPIASICDCYVSTIFLKSVIFGYGIFILLLVLKILRICHNHQLMQYKM